MEKYNLTVASENKIPHDVLVEHIAVALRELNFTGKVDVSMTPTAAAVRNHPFDGPEVFDDIQLEPYTGPREKLPAKEETQMTAQYAAVGGPVHRMGAEGSLTGMPADPYPNVTRAISNLKGARGAQAD